MAIESKGWQWEIVGGKRREYWQTPSEISYYLLHRWAEQGKKDFLDHGCGVGRHSILFASNNFNVTSIDLNDNALESTKKWADDEGVKLNVIKADFLKLPLEDETIDCALSYHVISHTDTEGVQQALNELYRVLRKGGEVYLTLGSKNTWGWKQDWPKVDDNTKLRQEEGPENNVPHFYADIDLVEKLFSKFEIIRVHQEVNYMHDKVTEKRNNTTSYHFHVLAKKK